MNHNYRRIVTGKNAAGQSVVSSGLSATNHDWIHRGSEPALQLGVLVTAKTA